MNNQKVMLVLTSKNLETMILEGGCGHWKAKPSSILACRYVVATRNKHSTWVQGQESHGAAFLIGEIEGVSPIQDRSIVKISRFSEVNIKNVWIPGGSNPVRYVDLADLKIDVSSLDWKPWPSEVLEFGPEKLDVTSTSKSKPLTISEAKEGLALTFGVGVESIEITIRG